VRSYREGGRVKQEVIHLGEHSTVESALESWPQEVKELKKARPKQAEKLQSKSKRLHELTEGRDIRRS
jgi:prefoldin subunit 5